MPQCSAPGTHTGSSLDCPALTRSGNSSWLMCPCEQGKASTASARWRTGALLVPLGAASSQGASPSGPSGTCQRTGALLVQIPPPGTCILTRILPEWSVRDTLDEHQTSLHTFPCLTGRAQNVTISKRAVSLPSLPPPRPTLRAPAGQPEGPQSPLLGLKGGARWPVKETEAKHPQEEGARRWLPGRASVTLMPRSANAAPR